MSLERSSEHVKEMQLNLRTHATGLSARSLAGADAVVPTRISRVLGGVLWMVLVAVLLWVGQL